MRTQTKTGKRSMRPIAERGEDNAGQGQEEDGEGVAPVEVEPVNVEASQTEDPLDDVAVTFRARRS